MKNYSLKTKANSHHSRNTRGLLLKLLFVGVVFLILFFAKQILATVTSFVTTPIFQIKHYFETSSATIPVYVRDRNVLEQEIQTLKQEIDSQKGIHATLTYLENENEELRALLGASHTPSVTAGVIARPPLSPYDTLMIDRGSEDGVVSGAPVFYGANIALGYVRAVYAHHALITLFSSSNVQSTVYVFGPDIFTTAYGEGGGVVRLSIPQGVRIAEGDLVTLPSLGAGVLGTVSSVESTPTEPEQNAYVRLTIPLQSIRLVRVAEEAQKHINFEEARAAVQEVEKSLFTVSIPSEYVATSEATSTATTTNTQHE